MLYTRRVYSPPFDPRVFIAALESALHVLQVHALTAAVNRRGKLGRSADQADAFPDGFPRIPSALAEWYPGCASQRWSIASQRLDGHDQDDECESHQIPVYSSHLDLGTYAVKGAEVVGGQRDTTKNYYFTVVGGKQSMFLVLCKLCHGCYDTALRPLVRVTSSSTTRKGVRGL